MQTYTELVKESEDFKQSLSGFLKDLDLKDASPDEAFAFKWLSENFQVSLGNLIWTETLGKCVQVQEPILLVTPGTGMTTGVTALFWAYIAAKLTVDVHVSQRDDFLRQLIHGHFLSREVQLIEGLSSLSDDQLKDTLREYGTVIVYGSNSTVDRYRNLCQPDTRFVGYGSKFSIGLHTGPIEDSHLPGYLRDIVTYNGLGCLNTSVLYVEELDEHNKGMLAELEKMVHAWYQQDNVAHQVQSRFAQDMVFSPMIESGQARMIGDLFVQRESNFRYPVFPLPIGYGTLYVVDLQGQLEELSEDLRGCQKLLSSATLSTLSSGPVDKYLENVKLLTEAGVQRVCHIGQAQNPSLSWSHDGQGNLVPFVKLLDVEG